MCDINVYVNVDGREELVLENVDQVHTQGDKNRIINIFGEEKILEARLDYYNNSRKKMVFIPV
ncbi:MAG: CooT family nickel-binding protein [Desulfococcaceae bacterium]|nr:CooT family nickel-binding protein [Desulfococcaceae bacterium]